MASTRQFDHALALLSTLGHAIGRINGCHVHLRAPTGADRGTVSEWIDSLSSGEASRLIDVLLAEGTSLSASGQRAVSAREPLKIYGRACRPRHAGGSAMSGSLAPVTRIMIPRVIRYSSL